MGGGGGGAGGAGGGGAAWAWAVTEAARAARAAEAAEAARAATWPIFRDIFSEAIDLGPHGQEDPVYVPRAEALRQLVATA